LISVTTPADPEVTTSEASQTTASTTENFVRFIHPDEWTQVMSDCLEEELWSVEVQADVGLQFPR
jgi:hypothetical protein